MSPSNISFGGAGVTASHRDIRLKKQAMPTDGLHMDDLPAK